MKKQKDIVNPKRRRFLGLSLTGGGAALLAGVKGTANKESMHEENRDPQQPKGYRVTSHVKKYYLKARI